MKAETDTKAKTEVDKQAKAEPDRRQRQTERQRNTERQRQKTDDKQRRKHICSSTVVRSPARVCAVCRVSRAVKVRRHTEQT